MYCNTVLSHSRKNPKHHVKERNPNLEKLKQVITTNNSALVIKENFLQLIQNDHPHPMKIRQTRISHMKAKYCKNTNKL